MVSNQHYIELYVQGQLVELESQESLNLRINNVVFNPTQTVTRQSEYSYSFDIPSTPNNDKIFGYANVLSKLNKFHTRYSAEVYADGTLLFKGSLTIRKYSSKDKMYECNLVNIKVNSLEDIFGEMVMTDLKWMVDFDGAPTINQVNNDYSKDYFFPLVSYGVFQKNYVSKDEVGATYTSKFQLDKYNKWWIESFYPSLKMGEVMKKAFEQKGYEVVGDVFQDPYLNWIYGSCNLASEQVPIYNLGNPRFGNCSLKVRWNNYRSVNETTSFSRQDGWINSSGGLPQDLNFPYYKISPAINASNSSSSEQYNFSTIDIWNMMDSTNNSAVTVNVLSDTYMYDPNEQLIVIPSDGWYRIYLSAKASLSGVGTTFKADQWTNTFYEDDEFKEREVTITRGLSELTPLEIQLVRNYDGNVELIKGRTNIEYATGDPNQTNYTYRGDGYTGNTSPNKTVWDTDFPHQDLYSSKAPTKTDSIVKNTDEQKTFMITSTTTSEGTSTSGSGTFGGRRANGFNGEGTANFGGSRATAAAYNTYGYMHRDGYVMPYDQSVSEAFICGFSTIGNGTVSVMRNGKSWSKLCAINNQVFADVNGMDLVNKSESGGTETVRTEYCANTYRNARAYYYGNNSQISQAIIDCCVYLKRNDVLELMAVQRDYGGQKYATSAECEVQITAISERSEAELRSDPTWSAYSRTEFPYQLNLFNFTNKEMKVVDWINDVKTAFNLDIIQEGNTIEINTNQGIKKDITNAIDIDNRVYNGEVTSEYISYPREMSVRYKIDTDEWGFETTVPESHINDEDWKEWGDSGYTVIQLNDDTYETSTRNTQTNFSYTWYDDFLWKEVYQDGTENESYSGRTLMLPVIEKAEFMADGYGYEDAMAHDGYSLTQRFWYRDQPTQEYIWTADHMHDKIWLTIPMNTWNGFNLSYKDTEKSILTEYFNATPYLSSNYVNVDVYISPQEYNDIKNGALIHFDSDLYLISEINGYDPSGNNKTTLKMIKKV